MQTVPLVITSINPFGRVDHQLRCFRAWKALGLRIRSVNIGAEAARLRALGLDPEDIIELSPGETAQGLHHIPSPRILPVLYRLQHAAEGATAMLVNSDLFPAMRPGAVDYWADQAPALALTREECASPETHQFLLNRPYRGGLDIFVFRAGVLDGVIAALRGCEAAERMAFGIPGWDYLMGMVLRSPAVGGMIADSGLLLHESHRTSYSNMEEFGNYLPDMSRLTGETLEDPTAAAARINLLIQQDCLANIRLRDIGKAVHYREPDDMPAPDTADMVIAQKLVNLSPSLGWWLKGPAIARLARRERSFGPPDFSRALYLFEVNPDPHYRFAQRLQAILFCLMCSQDHPKRPALTQAYPPNNLHGKVVEMIRANCPADGPHRRFEFAHLFGSELVDHGIFNPRLYNYLVESCETAEERMLTSEILINIRSLADAA